MDAYTQTLLGMAVEACRKRDLDLTIHVAPDDACLNWHVETQGHGVDLMWEHIAPTLADALAALLRDLGVEVPERPTAERVAEVHRQMRDDRMPGYLNLADAQHFYTEDRLAVLALLEEGS